MAPSIERTDLTKHLDTIIGIDGVEPAVETDEVFGVLGLNGPNESTTTGRSPDFVRSASVTVNVPGTDARANSQE